ncbi:hypothetical protein K474DRAFT_923829 [Panus rudis PR-1116 ss-1]|nr:hypothetical protein K474DRAFT_923829 [Panus rudis PR-1116 ss-1]
MLQCFAYDRAGCIGHEVVCVCQTVTGPTGPISQIPLLGVSQRSASRTNLRSWYVHCTCTCNASTALATVVSVAITGMFRMNVVGCGWLYNSKLIVTETSDPPVTPL